MRRILFSIAATLMLVALFSNKAQAQTYDALENQAIAAAAQCAQPYHAPHSTTEAQLVVTARCINGGTVYVWEIYEVYHCPPPSTTLCLVIAPVLVATVTTDCEGKIDSVTCH